MDRREPGVEGARSVATLAFEVVEERGNPGRVEVLDIERRRLLAGLPLNEGQEQSEGVAIGGDRVRAGVSLVDQPVGEERLQRGRQRTHRSSCTVAFCLRARFDPPPAHGAGAVQLSGERPSLACSSRCAARPRSSGEAERYQ